MIPTPSKLPFGNPLPEACLEFFCHPSLDVFAKPVRDPADNSLLVASGYWAVRFRNGMWLPRDYAEASPEFLSRINTLCWGNFTPLTEEDLKAGAVEPSWRRIDDARSTIYKGGTDALKLLWHSRTTVTMDVLVRLFSGPLVPLALLQLIARLPRCEISVAGNDLLFRFNGGEGIVPDWWPSREPQDRPVHKFSLFIGQEEREFNRDPRSPVPPHLKDTKPATSPRAGSSTPHPQLPTTILTPEDFEALPITQSNDASQSRCRYRTGKQWILIDPDLEGGAALIEVRRHYTLQHMIDELAFGFCQCGGEKSRGLPFCHPCEARLGGALCSTLRSSSFGRGYEAAYSAAMTHLNPI